MAGERRIRIQLCGRLRVEIDGRHVEERFGGRTGENLFAFLVLNRFRHVSQADLVSAVCSSEPPAAELELDEALGGLQQVFPTELVAVDRVQLALPADAWVDVEAAEESLYRGEGARAAQEWGRAYSAAQVARYVAERGFLPGCDLAWAVETRRRIEDLHVRALECCAAAGLGLGGSELPVAEKNALRAAELAPFRESAHSVLMEVLAARGNEAEALRVYQDLRGRLHDHLGTSPGRVVEEVRARMRKDDEPSFFGGATTRTFMFTDVVGSTNLLEVIGDDAWHDLRAWHHQTLRALFAAHGGEEVDQAGDGFFVAFPDARAAVGCAIAIQRRLRDHRREHGFAPQVRIGVHTAQAVRSGASFTGMGVHEAARIGAEAKGGEIVASRRTVDGAAGSVTISAPRPVQLKGIADPVEVVTIEWRGPGESV